MTALPLHEFASRSAKMMYRFVGNSLKSFDKGTTKFRISHVFLCDKAQCSLLWGAKGCVRCICSNPMKMPNTRLILTAFYATTWLLNVEIYLAACYKRFCTANTSL